MRLVDIEDVNAVLVNTDELSAYAFKVLDEKISKIEIRAVIRDCNGCMGGAFNDCVECEKFKIREENV